MKWFVPFAVFLLASLSQAQDPRTYFEERAKVKLLTDQQLIDCLRSPKGCALDARSYYIDDIKRELAGRKHPDPIIAAYKKADDVDRYVLVQTLWHIDDPLVENFMRSIAFDYRGDGPDDYSQFFALDYLAQRCDLRALARLNRDINFKTDTVMGCYLRSDPVRDLWAGTVAAFGRCNYVPAAQNLARSLTSGCLSTDRDEAKQSLKQIFPGYCSNHHSIEEKQQCYERLLHPDPKTTNH